MSQVSFRRMKPEIEARVMEIFVNVMTNSKHGLKATSFIELFLTPTEKIMFSKRVAISIMVKRGYSYDLIKDYLKVSQSTISSIVNQLRITPEIDQEILDKIIKNRDMQKMLGNFEYNLRTIIPPKGRNWKIWRTNIENEKKLLEIPL